MSDPRLLDVPIHPHARAALPREAWEQLLHAHTPPRIDDVGEEILNWERPPDRGVLHDPPERMYILSLDVYFEYRDMWVEEQELPWPRRKAFLKAWAHRVGMTAYGVNVRGHGPAAACLVWPIQRQNGHRRSSTLYIPDLVWDPQVGVRTSGRYLLQDLYLRQPDALAVVDMVPVSSEVNAVLMALGYRVYHRWGTNI